MPDSTHTAPLEAIEVGRLEAEVGPLGRDIGEALRTLIDAIPGAPHRPTPLGRLLGMNRVIASKMLNAIARQDPFEVLQHLPGPDSLRVLTRAAPGLGVPEDRVEDADETIERFETLIRRFGTRGALNAAISPRSSGLQQRFENASRYHVFRGMRQILGVEADTWLTAMLFAPNPDDDEALAVTTIHGALGMRRLRPDVSVCFTFGPPPADPATEGGHDLSRAPIGLEEFYTHAPASLETHEAGGQLVHRLANDTLGRHALADMLAVSHDARGSRRYAAPGRTRGGVAIFADVPVRTLVCDALLHDEAFPGAAPELLVYNPGARGPANPNDPTRDVDRVDVPERIDPLGKDRGRFDLPEVPRYSDMIGRVCERAGHHPDAFRVYRVRMAYPVHGFQFVMAFDAPEHPR
jgi:hypothetical protein